MRRDADQPSPVRPGLMQDQDIDWKSHSEGLDSLRRRVTHQLQIVGEDCLPSRAATLLRPAELLIPLAQLQLERHIGLAAGPVTHGNKSSLSIDGFKAHGPGVTDIRNRGPTKPEVLWSTEGCTNSVPPLRQPCLANQNQQETGGKDGLPRENTLIDKTKQEQRDHTHQPETGRDQRAFLRKRTPQKLRLQRIAGLLKTQDLKITVNGHPCIISTIKSSVNSGGSTGKKEEVFVGDAV